MSKDSGEVVSRAMEAWARAQAHRGRDGSFREADAAEAFGFLRPDHELVPYMTR